MYFITAEYCTGAQSGKPATAHAVKNNFVSSQNETLPGIDLR